MILETVAAYKREGFLLHTSTDHDDVQIRPARIEDAAPMAKTGIMNLKVAKRLVRREIDNEASILFVIESDGRMFGQATLLDIDATGCAHYNRVLRMVQGVAKGGMTVAIREIDRFGFEDIGLSRIALGMFTDNERVGTIYRSCGFVVAGEDEPLQRNADGRGWGPVTDPSGKIDRYSRNMELTRERFESLRRAH